MKSIALLLSFLLCVSLVANSKLSLQKLIDIQLEISYLAKKREWMMRKTSTEMRQEVNAEITSMDDMLSYHWGDFVSKLKNAQRYEKMTTEDKEELHRIDWRLSELITEAQRFLETPVGPNDANGSR